ncbi:MAG: acetyl-CoA carboxylase carboxyl transferase subunit beta [Chloroflexi bacterium]|nr:acetyl-CoA carboxylase carboxyl transferase subunit beta [Chloroflexota bacterium]
MKDLISYGAYLVQKEKLRKKRPKTVRLTPLQQVPEEEAVCFSCGADLFKSDMYQQYRVCNSCGFHQNISAWERIYLLADPASFIELELYGTITDPSPLLGNEDYEERIREARERTGLSEAVIAGTCTIGGNPAVLAVLDFGFLGGNMGMVVGDRIAKAFETATSKNLPIVTVVSSGGARIEEGVLSLVQMAKTITTAKQLYNKNLAHISILTHPTTGEVYASFANLGDVIFAEPKAMIGFAPLRVVAQTEKSELSEMGHTAESHLEHGLIDQIVHRTKLRNLISITLDLFSSRYRLGVKKKVTPYMASTHPQEQAWDTIQLARHEERPTALDYITEMTQSFVEIHGDRSYRDDPAIVCGLAELGGQAVVIIGQQRDRNEGRTTPEGFRKAQRAMKMAAKFGLPLINLIDTPGAYPGAESEERGIGNALASTMSLLSDLPTPVISVIIGQGGSEGALALGIANRVLIMENAFLSVIPPERAASIMLRDVKRAEELASTLKLTAADCKEFGVVDLVVPEPAGGAHTDPAEAARLLRNLILRELLQIQGYSPEKHARSRYKRFRYVGSSAPFLGGIFAKQTAQIQKFLQGEDTTAEESVQITEEPDPEKPLDDDSDPLPLP